MLKTGCGDPDRRWHSLFRCGRPFAAGIDPATTPVCVTACSSDRFVGKSVNFVMTLTRSNCQRFGYWLSTKAPCMRSVPTPCVLGEGGRSVCVSHSVYVWDLRSASPERHPWAHQKGGRHQRTEQEAKVNGVAKAMSQVQRVCPSRQAHDLTHRLDSASQRLNEQLGCFSGALLTSPLDIPSGGPVVLSGGPPGCRQRAGPRRYRPRSTGTSLCFP